MTGQFVKTRTISIRAPLAGSDVKRFGDTLNGHWISIRAPLAGSDVCNGQSRMVPAISIRAPLAGSDPGAKGHGQYQVISIRAPLAGSDEMDSPSIKDPRNFNPRSPCGERPLHFVASIYYQQSVVFSKTVTANSVDKLRKTTAKSAITRCEPHS